MCVLFFLSLSLGTSEKSSHQTCSLKKAPNRYYLLFSLATLFFSTQPQCCLTFSWIELKMLLKCCLIHKSIIILRHFLYLLYLCPCLDLWSVWSVFHFHFHFHMINHIISWKQTHLFFCLFFRICPIIIFGWQYGWRMNSFQIAKVQPQGVA